MQSACFRWIRWVVGCLCGVACGVACGAAGRGVRGLREPALGMGRFLQS